VVRGGMRWLTGQVRRRRSPAARGKGWGGISESLRTWRHLGSCGGSLLWRRDRDRRPVAEVNSGGRHSGGWGWRGRGRGASRRCGEARGEFNWGREGSGVGVPRWAGAAAGGDRRQPSRGRCDALGEQLRGHRASLGHKESSCGVVVVWGWLRRPVHGE
jgi:hypothetical protein